MKNLRFIPFISIHQPIVKAAFAFDRGFCAHASKKDFANIKRHVERDFQSIEGKPESEQFKIIHSAYQKLREKDNEIRNNLKLMDIKLADIVLPIKAAK